MEEKEADDEDDRSESSKVRRWPLLMLPARLKLRRIAGAIMGQPETYLNAVGDAFNEQGECVKDSLQKVLEQYLAAFAAYRASQTASAAPPSHHRRQLIQGRTSRPCSEFSWRLHIA